MIESKELLYPKAGKVTIQQLGTSKALKYSVALGKAAAAVAPGFMKRTPGKESNDKLTISYDPVVILQELMGYLDEETSPDLIKSLIMDSVIAPAWNDDSWYETKFSANFTELFLLLKEIIEFNYGGALELVGKTMAPVTTEKSGAGEVPETSEKVSQV